MYIWKPLPGLTLCETGEPGGKKSLSGRDKVYLADMPVEVKIQLQSHSTCMVPILFQTSLASPSTKAKGIICKNCFLRMTDLTNSTDSICIINNKHNYTDISTILPDSAAITGWLTGDASWNQSHNYSTENVNMVRHLCSIRLQCCRKWQRSHYIIVNRLMQKQYFRKERLKPTYLQYQWQGGEASGS